MPATVTSVLSFYSFHGLLKRPPNAFAQDSQEGCRYVSAEGNLCYTDSSGDNEAKSAVYKSKQWAAKVITK